MGISTLDPSPSETSYIEDMESGTDIEHPLTRIWIHSKSLIVTDRQSGGASHPLVRQGTDLILARAKCQEGSILHKSLEKETWSSYMSAIRDWVRFSLQQQLSYLDANRNSLSTFLQWLNGEKASIGFIKTARFAISTIFSYIIGIRFGEYPLIKATLKALGKQSPEKPRKKRYADPEPVSNWLKQQQLLELNDKQLLQRLSVQFILLHAFRFADCERMKWTDIEIEDDSFTIRVPAKSDLTIMKETTITRNMTRKGA
ncbi:MAG: hypothetical protein EZS28_046576 [Streblomastix strix]|uniref:Tyr recombinase domain-containing protein n=1 Tax=Streblomastix strix TaxID=222440 RepID=A0A5J4TI30_9EUKA|nr:MAG: hypothetical protein EZS28_046576 [Streblomastix strix]